MKSPHAETYLDLGNLWLRGLELHVGQIWGRVPGNLAGDDPTRMAAGRKMANYVFNLHIIIIGENYNAYKTLTWEETSSSREPGRSIGGQSLERLFWN